MFLLCVPNSSTYWTRHGKYEHFVRMDVFILQTTICPLTPAGFLFPTFSFKFPVIPLHSSERPVSRCFGKPCEKCTAAQDSGTHHPLYSDGNIAIELLKTGLENRHWGGQGDFFPPFSLLTGLHCGFVCGKPWFQTRLTQAQPDPNMQPGRKAEIGFSLQIQLQDSARVAPLILPLLHVEPLCRTVKLAVASHAQLRHRLQDISLNLSNFFLRITVIISANTISTSCSRTNQRWVAEPLACSNEINTNVKNGLYRSALTNADLCTATMTFEERRTHLHLFQIS